MSEQEGYIGPLDAGDWRCPSCGNDPSDPSLHMEGCRLTPLTAQDWADLIEAIRPPTAWSDYGEKVTARLLDHDDAEFAMRTLAPVVARIAERAEADLAAMTGFRDECERQYQAAVHAQGQAEADLADEKRRRAGLRAAVEAFLWALDNNANAEPDDMWEPIVIPAATALRALLDTATEETP